MNSWEIKNALERHIEIVRADIERQVSEMHRDFPNHGYDKLRPELWQDRNGRYVLLDAITALAGLVGAMQ